MSNTRIFFPSCPSRFTSLMSEFLYRTDPARTACMENEVEDEYDFITELLVDFLVDNDGVLTAEDWASLSFGFFGSAVEYPFGEKNLPLVRAFFPQAMVHINGVQS